MKRFIAILMCLLICQFCFCENNNGFSININDILVFLLAFEQILGKSKVIKANCTLELISNIINDILTYLQKLRQNG